MYGVGQTDCQARKTMNINTLKLLFKNKNARKRTEVFGFGQFECLPIVG
jgi:hypothetical protein